MIEGKKLNELLIEAFVANGFNKMPHLTHTKNEGKVYLEGPASNFTIMDFNCNPPASANIKWGIGWESDVQIHVTSEKLTPEFVDVLKQVGASLDKASMPYEMLTWKKVDLKAQFKKIQKKINIITKM